MYMTACLAISCLINMLHDGQSGFRSKHSYETALNHMVHKWASAIDKGLVNGVVLVDLRKAFDLVSHTILLDVHNNRCDGSRHTCQSANSLSCSRANSRSNLKITTGVPQGSILGPLFFILCL